MAQFYTLEQTHGEIQDILNKVEKGYVLSENEFNKLIVEIGLDQIAIKNHSHEVVDRLTENVSVLEKITLNDLALLHGSKISTAYDNAQQALNEIDALESAAEEEKVRVAQMILDIQNDILGHTSELSEIEEMLDAKVGKREGFDLSSNDFENKYKEVVEEILGNGRSAQTFVENIVWLSIYGDQDDSPRLLGVLLDKKADKDHVHDNLVEKIEGKALSTEDFTSAHKSIVDDILKEGSAADFVEASIMDSEYLDAELLNKSDIDHLHDDYVEKIEGKGLTEAELTHGEKAYINQLMTNTDTVIDGLITKNIITEGSALDSALDLKVNKQQGYSLVDDEEINKLANINAITDADIDNAISDVFK